MRSYWSGMNFSKPLSPCGRGRGPPRSGGRVRGTERSVNGVEHAARAAEDVVVPEPQDGEAFSTQEGVAAAVVIAVGVLRSVGLNDQTMFKIDKVNDIPVDDDLPLEFVATQTLVTQD